LNVGWILNRKAAVPSSSSKGNLYTPRRFRTPKKEPSSCWKI
jgi:hypothetical protein